MTYAVKTFNHLGSRLDRGYAAFSSQNMATSYMWGVIRDCRKNKACQIRTVGLFADDNLVARATV